MASKKISQLSTGSSSPSLSAVTVLSQAGTSYQIPLSTLRKTLVDSGSHYFTGSQTISGSLNVTSQITASSFVGDGSQLTNLPITADGQSPHLAYFTGSGRQNITGSLYMHIVRNGQSLTLGTDAYNQLSPERLLVDNPGEYNIATFQSSINDYAELNIKNYNAGPTASVDLVFWVNDTTEYTKYANIGLNSSTNNGNGVGFAGDAYFYNYYHDLYLGAYSLSGNGGHVHLFGGGRYVRPQISIFGDKTIGFNINVIDTGSLQSIPASGSGYMYEFSGSVQLDNSLKVSEYTILSRVSSSLNFADDAAAESGGVPLGGLYRDGNIIKIRLT